MARDVSLGRQHSVAVICFLPDYGHLQPLLKIADALGEGGFEIKCYVPDECAPLMRRFRFEFELFPNTRLSEQKKLLPSLFARGLFFNAACSYVHYLLCYPRIAQAASGAAQQLNRQLRAQRPDLILCDAHFFGDWCERIAASLGVPLIINSLDGSLAYNQRPFVQVYGATSAPVSLQNIVETAAVGLKKLCAHYYRLRHFGTWLRLRATRRAAKAKVDAAFPIPAGTVPLSAERLVVGTATVERDRLGRLIRTAGANRPEFPPIRFHTRAPIPDALSAWIARDKQPIVYVSFGSAVEFDSKFAMSVYDGLRNVPARILWSLPTNQQALLADCAPADNIRLETFVPQAEILAESSVRCFITQAGPNSVQEALLGGTPMLCIPFFADQGYNSATVEHLGVGRKLWHRQVSAQSISTAVTDVLTDELFETAARDIQAQLLQRDGGALITRHIAEVLRRRDARPDRAIGRVGPLPAAEAGHS